MYFLNLLTFTISTMPVLTKPMIPGCIVPHLAGGTMPCTQGEGATHSILAPGPAPPKPTTAAWLKPRQELLTASSGS